ncbi:helix-turn-helix transcriptional regulator [Actinomyces sp. ZJ308]|uniref:helix-turn-helix domain-containing protein n=1 Tax=Actinomyces sp. ZJ308 TaxID=2708342 RepID=UPI00141E7925|nr:helix-turn-helix transcriptional regulator [Actinomyces sp. ZJ308]
MTTIQEARHSLGVAQSELARRLGVSVASVSQTETREARGDITLRTRARYLDALGLQDLGIVTPRIVNETEHTLTLSPDITSIDADSAAATSRSRRRSLMLHRLVDASVNWSATEWRSQVADGIARNESSTRGTLHRSSLERWRSWLESGDIRTMRERMCADDEDGCRLREVSPMAGFLSTPQRQAVIRWERDHYAT